MIEDKELGVKIAEDTEEEFWSNKKEETEKSLKIEERNIKILNQMLELCKKELS